MFHGCYLTKHVFHDIMLAYIIIYNMIIEDEFNIHMSIIGLNAMLDIKIENDWTNIYIYIYIYILKRDVLIK